MNCISFCPQGTIEFSRSEMVNWMTETTAKESRRAFLAKSSAFALGILAAGHALGGTIRAIARTGETYKNLVFPPGALNGERFARTCTSCQLCAINCPSGIIKSARLLGPVTLDYNHASCKYDCALCSSLCPSGALKRVAIEEKQWLRIGESVLDTSLCRVLKEKTMCDLCAQACPKGAIFLIDNPSGLKIPEVNAYHCIGCGACQAICPVEPKAIRVIGIEQNMMGSQY
jgi:ferredoxin